MVATALPDARFEQVRGRRHLVVKPMRARMLAHLAPRRRWRLFLACLAPIRPAWTASRAKLTLMASREMAFRQGKKPAVLVEFRSQPDRNTDDRQRRGRPRAQRAPPPGRCGPPLGRAGPPQAAAGRRRPPRAAAGRHYDQNVVMDDVVAVEMRLASGQSRYFLTWGRIQHAVNPQPLSDLVLRASRSFSLGGTPVSARVCNTLREAAESPDAPYFYECYLDFCHKPIPFGHAYIAWRAATDKAMQTGHEIAYCGRPSRPVDESTAHASRNEGRPEAI
jgi:hypothetical protein